MYKQIIDGSFNKVFENKKALFDALIIPFFILLAFDFLVMENPDDKTIRMFSFAFSIIIGITVAITTHRVLLLGANSVPKWGIFRFSKRELKFFLYSVAFMLMAIVLVFLASLIPFSFIVVIPIFLLVFPRLSLVFPAIAVDDKFDFSDSLEYTKNYKLLTLVTVFVIPVVVAIIVTLVYGLVIGFLSGVISPKLNILYSLLNIIITVFMISCLSSTYKNIRQKVDGEKSLEIKEEDELESVSTEVYLNEDTYRLFISTKIDESFEYIKNQIIEDYKALGFENIVIDKENSFMLKNEEEVGSYISLTLKEGKYLVEVYNSAKPYFSFLDKYSQKI